MSGIIGGAGSKSGVIGVTEIDYEEGDWTPIISDTSNNATGYSVQAGYYTKIGRKVFLTGRIQTSNLGSVSGNIVLGGFPFTVINSDKARSGLTFTGHNFNMSAGTSVIGGDCEAGQTYAYLRRWNQDAGTAQMTDTNWSADGAGYFSIFYVVA